MIENIKNTIHQSLNELFADATLDEMAGDYQAYTDKLKAIAKIADILHINTEIVSVSVNIKTGEKLHKAIEPGIPTNVQ